MAMAARLSSVQSVGSSHQAAQVPPPFDQAATTIGAHTEPGQLSGGDRLPSSTRLQSAADLDGNNGVAPPGGADILQEAGGGKAEEEEERKPLHQEQQHEDEHGEGEEEDSLSDSESSESSQASDEQQLVPSEPQQKRRSMSGGLSRRVRRMSVEVVEKLASTISGKTAVGRGGGVLPCRFSECGCKYNASSTASLAKHCQDHKRQHAELLARALATYNTEIAGLRLRFEEGEHTIRNIEDSLTSTESATAGAVEASNHAAAAAQQRKEEIAAGRRNSSRPGMSPLEVNSMESLDAWLLGGIADMGADAAIKELEGAATRAEKELAALQIIAAPYKRRLCSVCGCVYTDMANRIRPSCVCHTGKAVPAPDGSPQQRRQTRTPRQRQKPQAKHSDAVETAVQDKSLAAEQVWSCCGRAVTGCAVGGCTLTFHRCSTDGDEEANDEEHGPKGGVRR